MQIERFNCVVVEKLEIRSNGTQAMANLKKLYTAKGIGDAHVMRGLLESADINAVIRGDGVVPLQGGNLMLNIEVRPSVWVLEDDKYSQAREIVSDYVARQGETPAQAVETWSCSCCGERVEQQFSECWNCGTNRPSS